MPYSKPPEKIKDMPKHAQDIWVSAFNAAFKEYEDEGKASATAYSAVKKAGYEQDEKDKWHKRGIDVQELWEDIKRLFAPMINEPQSIEKEYQIRLPTQTRALTITRDMTGKPRWMMIAASAVINKVGEIDSTVLFDNFVKRAQESGYPRLDFFHKGDKISFGRADWLKRDSALYLASGTFDDTELGRAAAAGLETQPGYWGASISYRVMSAPKLLMSEGQIPVYTDGQNDFISIVPRSRAANLFTTIGVAEEVNKRMNKATFDELVKLVGEVAAAPFAAEVDDANRTITETGMIMRAEEPPVAAPVASDELVKLVGETEVARFAAEAASIIARTVIQPVVPAPEVCRQSETPLYEVPVVMEPTISDIVAKLNDITFRLVALEQKPSVAVEESQRATDKLTDMAARLADVEASKERWNNWLNDVPENIKQEMEKVYRARNQPEQPMTLAQIAEQNLSKMNRGPHQRRP